MYALLGVENIILFPSSCRHAVQTVRLDLPFIHLPFYLLFPSTLKSNTTFFQSMYFTPFLFLLTHSGEAFDPLFLFCCLFSLVVTPLCFLFLDLWHCFCDFNTTIVTFVFKKTLVGAKWGLPWCSGSREWKKFFKQNMTVRDYFKCGQWHIASFCNRLIQTHVLLIVTKQLVF